MHAAGSAGTTSSASAPTTHHRAAVGARAGLGALPLAGAVGRIADHRVDARIRQRREERERIGLDHREARGAGEHVSRCRAHAAALHASSSARTTLEW